MPVRKNDSDSSGIDSDSPDSNNPGTSDRIYGAGLPTDPFADLTVDVEDFIVLEESTDPDRRRQAIDDFGGNTNPGMGSVGTSDLSEARDKLGRASQRLDGVIAEMKERNAGIISKPGYAVKQGTARLARIQPLPALMTMEYPEQGKLAPRHSDVQRVGIVDGEPAESLNIAVIVGPRELNATKLRGEFAARQQKHNMKLYKWDEYALDLLAFEAIGYPNDSPDIILISDGLYNGDLGSQLESALIEVRKKFRPSYFVALYFDKQRAEIRNHSFTRLERTAGLKFDGFFHHHVIGSVGKDEITSVLIAYAKSSHYEPERMVFGANKDKKLIEVPKGIRYPHLE